MSVYKQLRLEHALHNEKVCKHIDTTEGLYNDWVTTTAFYSAIHFVKHKVFPLTVYDNGIVILQTFDEYFNKNHNPNDNKHAAILRLVKSECSAILADYRQLKDICWGARYTDYKIDNETTIKAKELLINIKRHCVPNINVL